MVRGLASTCFLLSLATLGDLAGAMKARSEPDADVQFSIGASGEMMAESAGTLLAELAAANATAAAATASATTTAAPATTTAATSTTAAASTTTSAPSTTTAAASNATAAAAKSATAAAPAPILGAKVCCQLARARCLACAQGISVREFCSKPDSKNVTGCQLRRRNAFVLGLQRGFGRKASQSSRPPKAVVAKTLEFLRRLRKIEDQLAIMTIMKAPGRRAKKGCAKRRPSTSARLPGDVVAQLHQVLRRLGRIEGQFKVAQRLRLVENVLGVKKGAAKRSTRKGSQKPKKPVLVEEEAVAAGEKDEQQAAAEVQNAEVTGEQ